MSVTPMLTLYVTQEIRECVLLINNSNNTEDDFCFWPRWRKEIGYTVSTLNKRINRVVFRHWARQHRAGIPEKRKVNEVSLTVAGRTARTEFPGHCAGKGKPNRAQHTPFVVETVLGI